MHHNKKHHSGSIFQIAKVIFQIIYKTIIFYYISTKYREALGERYLGHVREVGKDNRGHVWASFLRIRVEHNVETPIRRWIPIAGKDGAKPRRFNVKYEEAPRFCFFCGIFWA